ncbi:MAG: class I SAM-dependent methyltransferase [Bacteroidales bacterium]|jgi:ubiquinone/menaquinone biosynthesis C-methylase UbiE
MKEKPGPPATNIEFDKAYSSLLHWMWSDIRIPKELKELVTINKPKNSLELGCGLGRFSSFMSAQGIKATGIDFSSVAIENAKKRVASDKYKPTFLVGDVTNLEMFNEQFDVSFDVGCFHCLNEEGQKRYVEEVYRLLNSGAIHLLWALDNSPGNIKLNPNYISNVFGSHFQLTKSKFSGRRIIFVASHWYWLVRKK